MRLILVSNRVFGNLLTLNGCRLHVGLHRITWRATCTALSHLDAIADAMAWLIGDPDEVFFDKSKSYHGPELILIEASTKKKKQALRSLARLGVEQLNTVQSTLNERIDNEHVIHFRLDLNELIGGILSYPVGVQPVKSRDKPRLKSTRVNLSNHKSSLRLTRQKASLNLPRRWPGHAWFQRTADRGYAGGGHVFIPPSR